ncbi:alcohol dehydrogenase catalytic domain-containing protein [Bacillus sp. FJAT-50079]|uniref:zinc-dependent alcohol dehydrogenase n=1 Tax=Bacillus sp. FJAT-50079 TaxID=2833577 RepID=UPI001BCA317F|nr:alcohol dehydrogenase catalytic domain-containing protein [Bacillus sp. FJAT-50079]MBS4207529.1 alcohol dehydrogenase catalytic domain-containing protein [Bacillus sp. FJAT-50079]
MKAIYYEGDKKLRIGECVPVSPQQNEVQIQVAYSGVCGTDLHIYLGHMDKRVTLPQIMGHEMSGYVTAIGEGVTNVKVGDKVTVRPLRPCMDCPACIGGHTHICHNLKFLGIETSGAFQRFWTVPEYAVHLLPEGLSLEHGALIEPLAVACHDVRRGEVKKGDFIVVIGGGPIGTLIALVAKQAGAQVVVSEINQFRIKLLTELGINVIHPLEELEKYVIDKTNGAGADVVFEVTSTIKGAETMTKLPRTRGKIVVVGIFSEPVKVDLHRFFWRELELLGARVYESEDFEHAIRLTDSAQLPLDKLITILPVEKAEDAFKQMVSGGKVMKILLDLR